MGVLFKDGHPGGPGRPKGARNKLATEFIETLYGSWQEHGAAAIEELRHKNVEAYVRTIGQLMAQKSEIDISHRVEESISEEHARLVVEGFLDSLRVDAPTGSKALRAP